MSSKLVTLTIAIAVVVGCILIANHLTGHREDNIHREVEELGGTVISIESRIMDIGPFKYRGKNDYIYRFEYELDGETKVGWVRFSLSDKWIWEE